MKSSKESMKELKKKIMEVITAIVFVALLIFASGIDQARIANYIGISVCVAWLGFFAITRRFK